MARSILKTTTLALYVLLTVVLATATLVEHAQGTAFVTEHIYHSGGQAEGGRGRIGKGCSRSYLLRCVPAGGDGVPRRTGEALSARFRIPPCFWVRLLQKAQVPVGS